jgi:hypothetical protein
LQRPAEVHAAIRIRLAARQHRSHPVVDVLVPSPVHRTGSAFQDLAGRADVECLFQRLRHAGAGPHYVCPSDYSGINRSGTGAGWNLSSYNVNGQVFFGNWPALGNTFQDGTSNTIFFVEHLALCRNPSGGNSATDGRSVWPAVNLTTGDPIVYWPGAATTTSFPGFPGFGIQYPTAMIPDPANGNVLSWKGPQVAPTMGPTGTCDPTTASSGHTGGVQVCLGDGSVRSVPETISLRTWNAALTPNSGDLIGSDW